MATLLRSRVPGATGMAGEGVVLESLKDPEIGEVMFLSRCPCGISHSKPKEVLDADFLNPAPLELKLRGWNARLLCLGFFRRHGCKYLLSAQLQIHPAGGLNPVLGANPPMSFAHVSGAGTEGLQSGLIRWARVKGKTENDLRRLGFSHAFAFRPGFSMPTAGLQHAHRYFRHLNWHFPLEPAVHHPQGFCILSELGERHDSVPASSGLPDHSGRRRHHCLGSGLRPQSGACRFIRQWVPFECLHRALHFSDPSKG